MDAVGSENDRPIPVFAMASPHVLEKSVVTRMRSWMNCGSSKVSSSITSGLRISMAIVHGPTATAPIAVGGLAFTPFDSTSSVQEHDTTLRYRGTRLVMLHW